MSWLIAPFNHSGFSATIETDPLPPLGNVTLDNPIN